MAELMLFVGLFAIFGALVGTALSLSGILRERSAIARSLAAIESYQGTPSVLREELAQPFTQRVLVPSFKRLVAIGKAVSPAGRVERIRRRLEEAGKPEAWDVDRVLGWTVLAAIGGGTLGSLVGFVLGGSLVQVGAAGFIGAAAGYFAPGLVVYQTAYNRSEQVRRDLPDALDLLSITVAAGLGFDAALAQVARNTKGPLAEELFRVLQEMQIGMGRAEALKALGERTGVAELRQFVTSMVQADTFGIPIANVLRIQSGEMRVKRSQHAEELAQKVPVKILFPLIFCILPTLFVVILGPAVLGILRSFAER